jgi:hypothetical protein
MLRIRNDMIDKKDSATMKISHMANSIQFQRSSINFEIPYISIKNL